MKSISVSLAMAAVVVLAGAGSASAANKEQQLLMAEIRMMQQTQQQLQQQLQQSIQVLTDTLKAVTGKLDDQTTSSRKALADQRLLIEGMTDTVRILRERSDDTNVRLSSINHEIESLRQTIASQPAPVPVAGDPSADPNAAAPAGTAPTTAAVPPPGVSAARTYDSAFSDYTAGQYELAIVGFQTFLKFFPRHSEADDAQLNIGNALYNAGKFKEAIAEYQRVVSDYPKTESVAPAYYKMGLSYASMKQYDLARKAFSVVTQTYPASAEATLAKQQLDRIPQKEMPN